MSQSSDTTGDSGVDHILRSVNALGLGLPDGVRPTESDADESGADGDRLEPAALDAALDSLTTAHRQLADRLSALD